MGITGLSSYMDNFYSDTSVFETLELNSCGLLIDGNSLLYRMHSLHFRSSHGGNYDLLHETLSNLLHNFAACKIQPIVLFDGGRDQSDRKLKTSIKRACDRLAEMNMLNKFSAASSTQNNLGASNKNKKNKSKSNQAQNQSKKFSISKLIESGQYKIFSNILPVNSFQIFIDLLEFHSIPHYQCFFEADYELGNLELILDKINCKIYIIFFYLFIILKI